MKTFKFYLKSIFVYFQILTYIRVNPKAAESERVSERRSSWHD